MLSLLFLLGFGYYPHFSLTGTIFYSMALFYKSRTTVLTLIIVSQLVVIAILGVIIYNKKSKVLGTVSVNPIEKENVVFSSDSQLTNFFEPQPGQTLKKSGPAPFEAIYTINSDTLNERFEYEVDKPSGTYRIITLGDSFTYGMYVDTKYNWTELLENRLNSDLNCQNIEEFEVINFGNVGYDLS